MLWRLSERARGRLSKLAGDAFRSTGSVRLARDGEVGEPVEGFTLHKPGRLRVYRP